MKEIEKLEIKKLGMHLPNSLSLVYYFLDKKTRVALSGEALDC